MSEPPRRDPLGADEREALRRVVGRLRARLEGELRRTLAGTYGIRTGAGAPEDESRLKLDPAQAVVRAELVGLWEALGRDAERLVREAAFTHTNRLVAIRVAEALDLLPESLAAGRRSSGFRQLLEVAPLLGADDDAGYWAYLQLCGDELAGECPRLFDPRNPLLRLRPPPSAVDDLVALVDEPALARAWGAPDTLGWTYQFFNSDEERSQMRRAHAQPQDSRELAVRNQFFTPAYVVGFLVHNSLGRRLAEGGFAELAGELEYLVDRPEPGDQRLDLAEVRVLDPAAGSGHFLLGAYDVLERAWALAGVAPGDAAPRIVAALWGIDIDARAAQVAAAAIVFRARRHRPGGTLPAPNVVCARGVPGGPAARAELLASVDPSRRAFLAELVDQLDRAPELGSLLKVDELLTGEVARRMTFGGGGGGRRRSRQETSLMDDAVDAGALDAAAVVAEVLAHAQAAADRVTSTPAERVLAAEGGDALRLVAALAQRYDAVLMNPPFGEPIPATKPYLKAAYPWVPTKDSNLFAAFVGRGLELCKPGGRVGAITSRAGMFLTTFERWRTEVVLGNDLTVLADLGHNVMHDALVEAAAYVVGRGRGGRERPATFLRLLREAPGRRPQALAESCARARSGQADDRVFRVAPTEFGAVPGSPMAYWVSPDIRRLFTDFPSLEGHGADVRQGLATGDDFRFVRAFWEVAPARIARTREETFAGKRWVPFAKGGEYSPFWADIHLVVDFERDGEELRRFPGSVIRNPQYYFRPGLTWPRRTQAGFNPSILPGGCAFADKGPGIIPTASTDPLALLGLLASRPTLLALGLTTTFGSYEVGAVARLPDWSERMGAKLTSAVRPIVDYKRRLDGYDETSRLFLRPIGTPPRTPLEEERLLLAEAATLIEQWDECDHAAADTLGLDVDALMMLDEEVGPIPVRATSGAPAVTAPRYVDAALEEQAAATGRSVREIVDATDRNWYHARPRLRERAAAAISYLVGCAFGRWDVRIGRDPSTAPPVDEDPFAPVPVCPPGMLVGPDGLPTAEAPAGYPLALTPHRVLVDEPGHPADIGAAAEAAAGALVDDAGALLGEVAKLLGVDDLRTYLRKRFFKDHLSRYSKSRRKAPIYWPLTIPTRGWTVWLYAPALSRESLYAVAGHAERRWNGAEAEMRRLESAQLQAAADAALARSLAVRLDAQRRLGEELRTLHKLLAAVAASGWVPDLDDGIVVCAAPLAAALLDWPKDPAEARARLRAGQLDWTAAHRWHEAL